MFLEGIKEWVNHNTAYINNKGLKIEHVATYGANKIELGVTNNLNQNVGSFEILNDGTL
jgi:hypothetical protein